MDNAAILAFINATLDNIATTPNALGDIEVDSLFNALLLMESHLSGPPDDALLRSTLKYFDPDDVRPTGRGRLINPLYRYSKDKKGIDKFLSWVRSEVERLAPPPAVGGRRRHRKTRHRKTRHRKTRNRKSRY